MQNNIIFWHFAAESSRWNPDRADTVQARIAIAGSIFGQMVIDGWPRWQADKILDCKLSSPPPSMVRTVQQLLNWFKGSITWISTRTEIFSPFIATTHLDSFIDLTQSLRLPKFSLSPGRSSIPIHACRSRDSPYASYTKISFHL